MYLLHRSPFRQFNAKEIKPIINRIRHIRQEPHIIRLCLVPLIIIVKQSLPHTQLIPVFIVRPHNKLHTVEKQPKQASHIRKHIINLTVLSLNAELSSRLVHLDVDEFTSRGDWGRLVPVNVVAFGCLVWAPWKDVGVCVDWIVGYLDVSQRACGGTECDKNVFFDNFGDCVLVCWWYDCVFHHEFYRKIQIIVDVILVVCLSRCCVIFAKWIRRSTWSQLYVCVDVSILVACPLDCKGLSGTKIRWHSTLRENFVHIFNSHILPIAYLTGQKGNRSLGSTFGNVCPWWSGNCNFSDHESKILVDCSYVKTINGNCKYNVINRLSWLQIIRQVLECSNAL